MADTVTVHVLKHENLRADVEGGDVVEFHHERDVETMYSDVLDALYPTATVAEYTFDASRVLRECDPVAYRAGLLDYKDAEFVEYQMPWEMYVSDDTDAKMAWFEDNRRY